MLPGRPRSQNWQQGIGVGFYDPEGDAHAVYPIAIVNGRAVYGGVVFEADDEAEIVDAVLACAGYLSYPSKIMITQMGNLERICHQLCVDQ
jgi:hypothetical protein